MPDWIISVGSLNNGDCVECEKVPCIHQRLQNSNKCRLPCTP